MVLTEESSGLLSSQRHQKSKKPGGFVKYTRIDKSTYKTVKDKKLRSKLKQNELQARVAAKEAFKAEVLLPAEPGVLEAEGMEKTYKFKQHEMSDAVDLQTSRKMFELSLPELGGYRIDYSRNGRYLLLGGAKGHLAVLDWTKYKMLSEVQVQEAIRDIKFLHNHTMFAVAQKKYVFIYDHKGTEIHCLKRHQQPTRLEFLPYHFLLASIGRSGYLKYQDTSTGELVSEHRTGYGACYSMTQNPYNAVIHTGHYNGIVCLWTPNMGKAAVKMFCHKGALTSLAIDRQGRYMVTTGMDKQMKVWDIRTFKHMLSYNTTSPATSVDISQRGMLAVGYGPNVQVWKDALATKQKSPYVKHVFTKCQLENLKFCPYEDILGVGHSLGFGSILVPGAGEPNFDTFEANPYETKKQRQELEVHSLLEKLQPDMISLDPNTLGNVDQTSSDILAQDRLEDCKAAKSKKLKPKNKMRGRGSSSKRYLKKQQEFNSKRRKLARTSSQKEDESTSTFSALDRFSKRS